MTEAIIHAVRFDGEGAGESVSAKEIATFIQADELAWAHLDVNHPETRGWLESEVSYLDPFILDALLAEETRPRMTQIDDGCLVILRGVNLNKNADPEDMVSIRMWVDEHRIITTMRRPLKAVNDLKKLIEVGKGPKNSGDFVHMLSARMFDRMEPVLTDLDDRTDMIEESLLEAVDGSLRESIVSVRKQAILLRRYMAPQRDAIGQLRMSNLTWLDETDKRQLQEGFNQVTRYVEDLDAIRERAQIVKDELANILADRLNKNMYILSVIAAIFLPLGFLTGLLGINVGGIPGTESPYAFTIFSTVLCLIVLLQIIIFKKLKWF